MKDLLLALTEAKYLVYVFWRKKKKRKKKEGKVQFNTGQKTPEVLENRIIE